MYGPLVKGGSWQQNWTNKDGRWVTAAEGPIFFACMIILFLTLGVVLTLEGLSVIRSGISDNQSSVYKATLQYGPLRALVITPIVYKGVMVKPLVSYDY